MREVEAVGGEGHLDEWRDRLGSDEEAVHRIPKLDESAVQSTKSKN